MSHALRMLEARQPNGPWWRTAKSYYSFTPKENRALQRGKMVAKWGKEFRRRAR